MSAPFLPAHLPLCPIDSEAYGRLYAFNFRSDDYAETKSRWRERRISPGLPEEAVYRLLPSAPDFEYGGYLTRTRVRFARCHPTRAQMPMSRACTFHSHPTSLETADVPSALDVFCFLNFRHLRTVTVGARLIWVMDKIVATMETVKKLSAWIRDSMVGEVRRLENQSPGTWHGPYAEAVLTHLGLKWPDSTKLWEKKWPVLLQEDLGIRVRLFDREAREIVR